MPGCRPPLGHLAEVALVRVRPGVVPWAATRDSGAAARTGPTAFGSGAAAHERPTALDASAVGGPSWTVAASAPPSLPGRFAPRSSGACSTGAAARLGRTRGRRGLGRRLPAARRHNNVASQASAESPSSGACKGVGVNHPNTVISPVHQAVVHASMVMWMPSSPCSYTPSTNHDRRACPSCSPRSRLPPRETGPVRAISASDLFRCPRIGP